MPINTVVKSNKKAPRVRGAVLVGVANGEVW